MAVSTPILLGVGLATTAGATVYSADQSRQATHKAADSQREALAALQAQPQPTIPGADAANAARRASISEQMRRRGRASTVLTSTDAVGADALGGGGA